VIGASFLVGLDYGHRECGVITTGNEAIVGLMMRRHTVAVHSNQIVQ